MEGIAAVGGWSLTDRWKQSARSWGATLEVIGVGFGRTGTMSLKVALEELWGLSPATT